jgi:hypothetical protein
VQASQHENVLVTAQLVGIMYTVSTPLMYNAMLMGTRRALTIQKKKATYSSNSKSRGARNSAGGALVIGKRRF